MVVPIRTGELGTALKRDPELADVTVENGSAGVVLGGSNGNKKNTGPADLLCRQTKVVYVLGTPIDFSRRAR